MSSHHDPSPEAPHPTEPPDHHSLNDTSRHDNQPPTDIRANPSPTAEMTALATHLRRLADRLTQLEATHTASLEQLATHHTHIQQLTATASATPPATSPSPINWPALTADQAIDAWEHLATWIAHVLVPWYDTTRDELPDCWPLHRPAVVELSWLHTTHTEAFAPGAAAHHAADWHTRWRPAALQRLHEIIPRRGTRHCGPSHHLTHPQPQRHSPPSAPPPRLEPITPQPLPGEQLAERHHWQPFLTQAITTDQSWRLHRDPHA